MAQQFKVGQKVRIGDGRVGTIKFIGGVSFKDGSWMGLALEDAEGKNDGSVRGERYFDCPPNHGLFIQPSTSIEILEQPTRPPPKANGKPATPVPKPRPSSISSTTSAARAPRPSISGTTAGKRASMAPSSMGPPSAKPDARRQSMAPPPTVAPRTSRHSLAPAPRVLSPKKPSAPPSRQSSVGGASLASRTPGIRSPASNSSLSPSLNRVMSPASTSSGSKAPARPPPPSATASAPAPSIASRTSAASAKAQQESETKIRLLDKKVQEMRQRIQELTPQAEKAEQYSGIVGKLQQKAQSQFQEISELKKHLKESETGFAQIESIQAEHDTNLEMATLDREMAEEKAEAYKADLDSIRARLEEMEIENDILKDENEELSKDMSPEERASQGWTQMQRENSRLREALLRMRDISLDKEIELREEIEALTVDSEELGKLKGEYDTTKEQLLETEVEVEDLREQLDAALASETMIEQLTERDLERSAQIEELRNTVEDLEDLKEINDEIELSHIEDNKQLQQEIDFKESLLLEHAKRVLSQEEELADRDYTIQRFRELVTNMQSDLEDMRASKEFTETQASELGSHSRAMMDLNRQLQASASSTRVKTIEMELRKLEAQEHSEHLDIVQLFLPEAFQSERDSVLALLRFKRIAFKSQLLHGFMKERIASPGPHVGGDSLLAACDALDKLTWINAMCDRFTSSISTSSLEQFAKFESVLYELEPVERALNGYIENLRKDELRDQQVADGLQRAIAVMQHLSELHLNDGLESFADEILMKTMLMQSNLETTAAALQITKAQLLRAIPASEEGDDSMSAFASKTDALAMQSRSARVIVGKILRSLQDLKARNLSLTTEAEPNFEASQLITNDLATSLRSLGLSLYSTINAEDRSSTFTFADLMSSMRDFNDSQDTEVFAPLQAKMKNLHDRLSDLFTVSQDLSNAIEFEKPVTPWVLRSKALLESKLVSQDAAQEISTLKREVHERGTTIKMREQAIEESEVKIELLEARMRDSGKKVVRIGELERVVEEAKGRQRLLERKLEERGALVARLEEERDSWMRKAAEMQVQDATAKDLRKAGVDLVGTSQEMDSLKRDIGVLESTIRYLRKEVRRTRAEEEQKENSWLSAPLVLPSKPSSTRERGFEAKKAFEALAALPGIASPVMPKLAGERRERLKWKPRKMTTHYQLYEAEMQWLDAKEMWNPGGRRGEGDFVVVV